MITSTKKHLLTWSIDIRGYNIWNIKTHLFTKQKSNHYIFIIYYYIKNGMFLHEMAYKNTGKKNP